MRIGQLLAAARDRLPKRTFTRWLESELPWSTAQAYRLMAVAEAFGPYTSQRHAEQIEATALYLLASPSVPPMAREYAVELARERLVTAKDAREILALHRQPLPNPTRGEMREYEKHKAKLGLDDKSSTPNLAEPSLAEQAWVALESLLETFDTLQKRTEMV